MKRHPMRRSVGWCCRGLGVLLAIALVSLLFPPDVGAGKRVAVVTGAFSPESGTVQVGGRVDVVLHLQAHADAPQVEVQFVLPPQARAPRGSAPWFGALAQNESVDLPLTIEFAQAGEYSIGATVKSGKETTSATLNVVATAQGAQFSTEPIFLMKLRQAQTPGEQKKLLEGEGNPVVPAPPKPPTPAEQKLNRYFQTEFQKRAAPKTTAPAGVLPAEAATSTTVSGVMNYLDTAGTSHPIRYALVQVLDGTTNALLAETMSLANGSYSAGLNAASVKVVVYTEDGLRSFAKVYPGTAPSSRYTYASPVTTVTQASTVINITTGQPVRGTPGVPSTDAIGARAFSVYDALMQAQVQGYGLRGGFLPQAKAFFPNGAGSPCPTISCYSPSAQEIYILREDALDWDVLMHEFIHFLTDQHARAGGRVVANNPGGSHSGGSAIGQIGRSRDAGMRLAWAEGFATFMGVRLQMEPASTDYGLTMPTIPDTRNTRYQDTEDAAIDDDLESMPSSEGYGSENSVAGMLWDFADTPSDSAAPGGAGQATDKFDLSPKTLWDLVSRDLACNPCDRVDRFWTAVMGMVGVNPTLLDVAETPALNWIAPTLVAPAHGNLASGGVSPLFQWTANGDPKATDNPNRFFLVISKDNFQSNYQLFPTNGQPLQTTQYTIPDLDFRALVNGATDSTIFTWVVVGYREADTGVRVPEGGGLWVSNSRTFQVRAYHIRLTWDKMDTDVDLHFQRPAGDDCAYYNTRPDWGVIGDVTDNPSLDRDCIYGCTEENITIDKVTDPGTYNIFAHYYSDHGYGGTTATVQIYHNGNLIYTQSQYLGATGDIFNALSFTVAPSGKIEAVVPTGTVTRGALPTDLPAYLQKSKSLK